VLCGNPVAAGKCLEFIQQRYSIFIRNGYTCQRVKGAVMMSALRKANDAVSVLSKVIVIISFSILIIACVLQVFTRFVLNNALSWTEELARYAFIWSNLAGAVICVRHVSHATVTAVTECLPRKAQVALKLIVQILIIAICTILVVYGGQVTWATRLQTSPALRVNMALINSSVPISALFMLIHSVLFFVEHLQELAGKGGDNT